MTATLETLVSTQTPGDRAYSRINAYREKIGEQFELRGLDGELAFYMHRLGASGLYLADATNNPAGTFKWRGALNKMLELRDEGVTSSRVVSAGNHLAGAGLAGNVISDETPDFQVHGYLPQTAPQEKKRRARGTWDSPAFHIYEVGNTFDETQEIAQANEHQGAPVHPYDDASVAAGQGTIADDILIAAMERGIDIQHVVVTVGGGGLFSGLTRRFHELGQDVTVHGVEATGNDSLSLSARNGRVTAASGPNPRYGGAAVKYTGQHTLDTYLSHPNARLIQVTDAEVAAVTEDYMDEIRYRDLGERFSPLEPTSLVAMAGLARIVREYPGEGIAAVGTGRNAPLADIWDKR